MFTYIFSCKLILVMSRDPQLSTCDINLTMQRKLQNNVQQLPDNFAKKNSTKYYFYLK